MNSEPHNPPAEGWRYVESDAAYHYFRNSRSLCSLFKMKTGKMTKTCPEPEDACIKCTQRAPSASNLSSDATTVSPTTSPGN